MSGGEDDKVADTGHQHDLDAHAPPAQMSEEPCCAHTKVVYVRQFHEGGTCSDRWECEHCKHEFIPAQPQRTTEREKRKEAEQQILNREQRWEEAENINKMLSQQLAAERKDRDDLAFRLNTAQEARRLLGDALEEIIAKEYAGNFGWADIKIIARNALAKVKKEGFVSFIKDDPRPQHTLD